MSRILFLILLFQTSLFSNLLFGQSDSDKFSRENFKGEMTNMDVIDAKRWHHQGLTEKSLKKGLEIISSNVSLTAIDSFYTYQTLAYNYRTLGANRLALEQAKKAVEIMERTTPSDISKITWISLYYSAVKQFEKAVIYMKKDVVHFQEAKDTLSLLKQYNDIGFMYSLNKQFDLAINYYNKVVLFKNSEEKYKAIIGLATGNLGAVYLNKGEYQKALTYIQIDADLSKERNKASYYNALNSIAECQLMLGNYAEAKKTLIYLLSLNHTEKETNLNTYRWLAETYEKTKENDKSLLYLKKYMQLKDSFDKEKTPAELIFEELSDAKIKGVKKDLELAESKAKTEAFKKNISITAWLLSFLSLALAFAYFRNKQSKKNEIQQLEKELIAAELKNKNKDLANVVTNLSYKRKFIDEVQEKLKSLHNLPEGKTEEQLTLIIREFNSYKSADKSIAILQTDMDKVNITFLEKLGKQFPALTEKEKEMCSFLLLRLSTKDIANIRNIDPNAVKKARQRIRKKLPISDSEDLIEFLENI